MFYIFTTKPSGKGGPRMANFWRSGMRRHRERRPNPGGMSSALKLRMISTADTKAPGEEVLTPEAPVWIQTKKIDR